MKVYCMRFAPIYLLAAMALASCGKEADKPKPSYAQAAGRLIGIDINDAAGHPYPALVDTAKAIGVKVVKLSLDWDQIEPTGGRYDFSQLDIANLYFPTSGLQVVLVLRPVNTVALTLPQDLARKAIDDSTVKQRFNAILDSIHVHLPALQPKGVMIGNEVDIYVGEDRTTHRLAPFLNFFFSARKHAKGLWGADMPVAPTLTGKGVFYHAAQTAFDSASTLKDEPLAVTYYALTDNYHTQDSATVSNELYNIRYSAGTRPLWLLEMGAPSDNSLGGPNEQARVVLQLFQIWDQSTAQQWPLTIWTWMTDIDTANAAQLTRFYFAGQGASQQPDFYHYLSSLGLRYPNSAAKPGWIEFSSQARKRSF